ncbi:MAG: phospholipase D-like domain-containing protein [Methanothrix sp.]
MSTESSYKSVEKLLFSKGRNLYIISPFISTYYLKILKRISSRKNVYLITSESAFKKSVDIAKSKSIGKPKAAHAAIILALFAVSYFMREYVIALVFLDAIAAWCMFYPIGVVGRSKNGKMHVRIVRGNFVHEKVYISDSAAITGSANLTYSGMHKNTERISIIDDKKEIAELRRHFGELWRRADE